MVLDIVFVLGYVTCVVTVAGSLTVSIDPKIWRTGIGHQVKFTCYVEGDGEYKMSWYKGQNQLTNSDFHYWRDDYYHFIKDNSLHIFGIRMKDAGVYTCVINNTLHTAQDTATLEVVDSIFIDPNSDVDTISFKNFDDVILPCILEGVTKDQVSWVNNYGQEIPIDPNTSPDQRYNLVTSAESQFNLQIEKGEVQDSGKYTCTSKISPKQMQILSLNISGRPTVVGGTYNQIDVEYHNADTSIMLDCEVIANPEANITWYRQPLDRYKHFFRYGSVHYEPNEKDLSPLFESDKIEIIANNSLYIRNVTKADEAAYQCRAVNSLGMGVGGYRLIVHVNPTVKVSPLTISAKLGETVSFECHVNGGPLENLEWYKGDSEEMVQRMRTTETYSVLRIESLQSKHAGTYRCKAKGKYKSAEDSVILTIPEMDTTSEMLNLLKELVHQQTQILEEQRRTNRNVERVIEEQRTTNRSIEQILNTVTRKPYN